MSENNENLEKKPDLGFGSNPENKDNLKESFSDLKNELNRLKNQIKEGQEYENNKDELAAIDKKIEDIDKKIEDEKNIEKSTGGEGKISNIKELKITKQINYRLAKNPGEANQGRAKSALKLLKDIHGQLDTNRIARGAQWIVQKLTK